MIATADFYNGLHIEVEGDIYTVIWFQHHKPGKGGAMMRTKLQSVRLGGIIERTFKSGERFRDVTLETVKKQYLYADNENFIFMDNITYEQMSVNKKLLGKSAGFLKEGAEVHALYLDGEFLNIELPFSVELMVTYTVPGTRGDTVSNVTKPATLETGAEVKVPLFIDIGDSVRVDTRTGVYIERA